MALPEAGATAPGTIVSLSGDEARALANRIARAKEIRNEITRRLKENLYSEFMAQRYGWQKRLMHGKSRVLALMAANRVGKTRTGAAWTTAHLTGLYPDDWEGNRFHEPVDWWAAGVTADSTRDIIQFELLGDLYSSFGQGMIPADLIVGEPRKKPGVPDGIDSIHVRHVPTGGISTLTFKSMEQGRAKFQGTKKHGIWLDEEREGDGGYDLFSEAKTRTMTIPNGQILVTYTPLNGMNEMAHYLVHEAEDILMVTATWEDAPHLGDAVIQEFLKDMKPHEIEARSKGIPVVREGLIYPFPESDITCKPFPIPANWPVVLGMDLGWTTGTTVIEVALDPQTDIAYVIAEYHRKETQRADHAREIDARFGKGIYIAVDPSGMRQGEDGKRSIKEYKQQYGLNLHLADNSVANGIEDCFDRYAAGKLKIFTSCTETINERRFYQYQITESGQSKPRKKNDHHMDAKRYAIRALKHARPTYYFRNQQIRSGVRHGRPQWSPADATVGY